LFISSLLSAQQYTSINKWLIAGSFTVQDNSDLHYKSFIDEPMIAPKSGEMAGKFVWKAVDQHIIDFLNVGFAEKTNVVAYAFVYVYSKENQLATLLLGCDGGAMVWVNGLLVWDKAAQPGVIGNEDKVDMQLSKGYNRVLVKVDHSIFDWELVCNLASTQPVEISIDYPSAGELAKTQALEIVNANVSYKEKNVSIIIKAANYGKSSADNVQFTLLVGDNAKLPEKTEKSIPAGSTDSVAFVFPLKQGVQILSQQGNQLSMVFKDEKNSILLPSSLTTDLLMQLAMDKALCDTATQKMVNQFNNAKELYGSAVNLSSTAITGLQYAADDKYDKIKSVLQGMLQELIKNSPDLSKDTICVIGHAHMDMNWLWPYSETKTMTHDNFRQDVALMEKYPDFRMLQSQISIYKHIEKVDPPLFEKVKKYVKEGRFEPVGGMWVEGDCNMSGGEALCRSFLLGQRFLYERFGKIAHVGWLPDDFGHISQFPQILNLAGCSYYYFVRCNPYSGTFWWKGPDSSKVLCFSGNVYSNSISPSIKNDVNMLSPVKRRILVPTGVGDHGGGPTLKDINTIHMLDSTPHYPSIKFTNAETFFEASLKEMDGRPTHRSEMQFVYEGCYTSIAEIKENTRKSEQSLYKTEFLSCLRWLNGEPYPASDLKDMWETVAFNQFHDILPGSAIYETYQDAVSDHKAVQKKANDIFETGFLHLADEITFKTGIGQPIVAINMQPRSKKTLVEAEIFTYEQPVTADLSAWWDYYGYSNVKPMNGTTSTVVVRDDAGKIYPAQITGGKIFPPGFHSRIQFVVDNMPAGGYKTFYVDASKPGISTEPISEKDGKFETDFFTVAFDMKTGDIIQLIDKRTGKDFVSADGRLNKLRIYMEDFKNSDAWNIGDIKEIQDITNVESVTITQNGPVRATVEVVKKWGRSKFIQRTYIYKNYPRIDFDLDAHWFETSDSEHNTPFLRATFDLAIENPTFYNHVPFAVVIRPTTGQEVPAQQWVDISDGKTGIALLNKTKFGHSFEKGQLRLSLLRATHSPDIYPNIGVNHIQYSLYPHSGDWKNGVWAEAENFNIPVYAAEPPSLALVKTHATRAVEDSLLIVSPSTIVMSGIKQAEDGKNLIIRLAEVYGNETSASITLPVIVKEANRVNIIEFPQESDNKPIVNGKKIYVKIKPHEIVTLSIKLND
jgi:alpha-mannosidase